MGFATRRGDEREPLQRSPARQKDRWESLVAQTHADDLETGGQGLTSSRISIAHLSLPFPRSGQGMGKTGIGQGVFPWDIGEFFFWPLDQLDAKSRFILQGYTTVLRPVRLFQ